MAGLRCVYICSIVTCYLANQHLATKNNSKFSNTEDKNYARL